MKKILSTLAVIGAVASVPTIASADVTDFFVNPYVSIQGGANIKEDHGLRGYYRDGERHLGNLSHNLGWGAGGALGASIRNDWIDGVSMRAEIEAMYRNNDVKGWDSGGSNYARGGYNEKVSVMANLIGQLDFWKDDIPFKPYIGAGIGWDRDWIKVRRGYGTASGDSFAYQGIAGASMAVIDNLDVFVQYVYHGNLGWKDSGVKYREDTNHTALAGVRFYFNQPSPPPPPPQEVVVAVPDSYLVFFDWDKATLTSEARNIISTAATNARSGNTSVIEVTGHTDTSGNAQYNMGLSKRRADAVANQLTMEGIPRSAIAIYAKGESEPLVATGDGVREPQNRRVVIVMR